MFQAVLSNPDHPDYGVVTIPFPIPHDQYAHGMELLEALEIGDAHLNLLLDTVDYFLLLVSEFKELPVHGVGTAAINLSQLLWAEKLFRLDKP